jgi:hypothetical protein
MNDFGKRESEKGKINGKRRIYMKKIFVFIAAALLIMAGTTAGPAHANQNVNLELSLLVDVSGSIQLNEFNTQRNGYASVFSNTSFYTNVVGAGGSIAVNFIEWSGAGQQAQVVGWTLINSLLRLPYWLLQGILAV